MKIRYQKVVQILYIIEWFDWGFLITIDLNAILYVQLVGFLPTGPSELATVDEKQKYFERLNRSPAASRYFSIIEKASPNDMIEKFVSTASMGAQAGLNSQIERIIGTLPKWVPCLKYTSKIVETFYMYSNDKMSISVKQSIKYLHSTIKVTSIIHLDVIQLCTRSCSIDH